LIAWLGVVPSKFYGWIDRYAEANEHNGLIRRDFWLERWEREAMVCFGSSLGGLSAADVHDA